MAENGVYIPDDRNQTPNLKRLILSYFSYWPLILISIGIAWTIAFFYLRYSVPVYQVNMSLMVKEANQIEDPTEMIFGRGRARFATKLHDESSILKSIPIVTETVERMDININYYRLQQVRKVELYGDVPFRVIPDSSSETHGTNKFLYNTPFAVLLLDRERFQFIVEEEDPNGQLPLANRDFRFGEMIDFNGFRFSLEYVPQPYIETVIGKQELDYEFVSDRYPG